MTARITRKTPLVIDASETRHSGVLVGPVRAVRPAIKRVGCAWQYDHQRHAYLVPRRYLDDVTLALELAGHQVNYSVGLW